MMRNIIHTLLYANLLPFLALFLFIFFVLFNTVFDRRQTRYFLIATLTGLLMLAVVSADYLLQSILFDQGWIWRRITSCLNFAAAPVIPLLLYKIFDDRPSRITLYLPLVLNAALCFASMFYPLVFFITPENTYLRGPLFFLPFSLGVAYMLFFIFRSQRQTHLRSKRVERMFLLGVIGLLVLSMVLEIRLRLHFMTWACTAPSLILYYLLLNIQSTMTDALTGLNNRLLYTKTLTLLQGRRACQLAMLDLNNFKYINDHFGHDTGDQYLRRVAGILSQHCDPLGQVFRIGGDEFVVISKKDNEERLRQTLDRALAAAQLEHIDFARGICTYRPGDDLHAVLSEADRRMYEDKRHASAPPETSTFSR